MCIGRILAISVVLMLCFSACVEESNRGQITAPEFVVSNDEGNSETVSKGKTQRSVEWVAVNGTFCFPDNIIPPNSLPPGAIIENGCDLFAPPLGNLVNWFDPDRNYAMWFDFSGIADDYVQSESGGAMSFGTSVSGRITEEALSDGRARIDVLLHVRNSFMYVSDDFTGQFMSGPTLLGSRMEDVLNGASPLLGSATLRIRYVRSQAGAPFLDLTEEFVFLGGELELLSTVAHGAGYFPDGSPGRVQMVQTAVPHPGGGATADGWPVESIRLIRTGN